MSVLGSLKRAKPPIWLVPGRAHPSQPNVGGPVAGPGPRTPDALEMLAAPRPARAIWPARRSLFGSAPAYEISRPHPFLAGGLALLTSESLTNAWMLRGWNLTGGVEHVACNRGARPVKRHAFVAKPAIDSSGRAMVPGKPRPIDRAQDYAIISPVSHDSRAKLPWTCNLSRTTGG